MKEMQKKKNNKNKQIWSLMKQEKVYESGYQRTM